jgi:hypothetical protein
MNRWASSPQPSPPEEEREQTPVRYSGLRGSTRLTAAWLIAGAWLAASALCAAAAAPAGAPPQPDLPRLVPDYVGVTLPPNIAPLNFRIQETGAAYRVELRSTYGAPLSLSGRPASLRIPPQAWRSLLRANPGQPFFWDIAVQKDRSGWTRFATVTNHIASEEIDPYLSYRLIKPLFNAYLHVGLYQRNLESFDQEPLLENDQFDDGCLNCHTLLNRRPDTFAFNIRGYRGHHPMILVLSNRAARVERTMGYLAWHPSGRLLAFSANKLSLFFHTRAETRDVYDAASDLGIYRLDSDTVSFPPAIAAPDRNETWPCWSPEGRYLYFSSAAPQPLDRFRHIRYDLMRVSYNLDTDQWGQPETMISSEAIGLSICQPRVSPDGRFLLVTCCRYGNFPIYQANSDLYVMDLASRDLRRLPINSEQADSWHSWSSNSRWVVFSSKRIDGLFARPHFTYVDAQGEFHKPFVLPQQDPDFYASCLNTFNVPELMQGPVTISERELARAVKQPRRLLTPQGPARPTGAGPKTGPSGGQEQGGYPARE